jgi:predicted MarR family transcription regulator
MNIVECAFEMRAVLQKLIGSKSIEWLTRAKVAGQMEFTKPGDLIEAHNALLNFQVCLNEISASADSVLLRNELARYVRAMNKIYNHNEAARAAVIQAIGTQHSPIAAHADLTAPPEST